MSSTSNYRTIKIPNESYDKMKALQAQVAASGWAVVGSKRKDPATQGSIIDVALDVLAAKAKAKSKK